MTDGLAGALTLRPGLARPRNLASSRPALVARLTTGQRADQLPSLLGSLFALCGHAHRTAAAMAVAAAFRREPSVDAAAIAHETLLEHLRRILLDWPRLLGGEPAEPVRLPGAGEAAAWVERHLLGEAPAGWLERWQHDAPRALADWASTAATPAARLLRRAPALAIEPALPLKVHGSASAMRRFAALLGLQGGALAREPLWDGRCAETGCWTRLHEPAVPAHSAALRLGARLAEVARLALGTARLARGALPLGPGEAVAWVEMARGLLIHHVVLDGARVERCHVVAPTEWNFHPHGPVARALESLGIDDAAQVGTLVAAYDPCVPYRIERVSEPAHA